jgi:signal transduction histidine kinase
MVVREDLASWTGASAVSLTWSADDALAMQQQAMQVVEHGVILVNDITHVANVNPVAARFLEISAGLCNDGEFVCGLDRLRQRASNTESLGEQMSLLNAHPESRISNWIWHFPESAMHLSFATAPLIAESMRGRVWVIHDVTALFGALQTVSRLEHRMKDLLTEGDVIAFRLRPGGVFDWISPSTMRMMGYDDTVFIGSNAKDFCHPDDMSIFVRTVQRLRTTGLPQRVAFRVPDSGGNLRTLEGRMFLSKDGSGCIDAILSDVSSYIELERLRHLMVSAASHEFKTPLAFMTTGLAMLEDGTLNPSTDEGRDVLDRMYSASLRLARMSESLLGLHKIEITRLAVVEGPTSVSHCVARAARSVPTERGIAVHIEDRSGGTVQRFDQDLIEQAVINLVDNAVQHSPDGGVVDVITDCRAEETTIIVRDRGDGISVDDRDRIFEPFIRLTRHRHGSGLGLSIVRRVAELHGGSVVVRDPNDGPGASFVLTIRDLEAQV